MIDNDTHVECVEISFLDSSHYWKSFKIEFNAVMKSDSIFTQDDVRSLDNARQTIRWSRNVRINVKKNKNSELNSNVSSELDTNLLNAQLWKINFLCDCWFCLSHLVRNLQKRHGGIENSKSFSFFFFDALLRKSFAKKSNVTAVEWVKFFFWKSMKWRRRKKSVQTTSRLFSTEMMNFHENSLLIDVSMRLKMWVENRMIDV